MKLLLIFIIFLTFTFCDRNVSTINSTSVEFDSLTELYKSILAKDSMDWSATFQLGELYRNESLKWSKLAETDSINGKSKSAAENNEKAEYYLKISNSYFKKEKDIASKIGDADYPQAK